MADRAGDQGRNTCRAGLAKRSRLIDPRASSAHNGGHPRRRHHILSPAPSGSGVLGNLTSEEMVMPFWKKPDPGDVVVRAHAVDGTVQIVGASGLGAGTQKAFMEPHGTGFSGEPHVTGFSRDAGTVVIQVANAMNFEDEVRIPADRLKLVQYVGKPQQSRKLYAEIRGSNRGWLTADPHQVTYLGEIQADQFPQLRTQMERAGIDWAWFPMVRDKDIG
jgi:hypothetical protein